MAAALGFLVTAIALLAGHGCGGSNCSCPYNTQSAPHWCPGNPSLGQCQSCSFPCPGYCLKNGGGFTPLPSDGGC